jgi:hypothetical protein
MMAEAKADMRQNSIATDLSDLVIKLDDKQ